MRIDARVLVCVCVQYAEITHRRATRGHRRGLTSVGFFFSVVHWFLWETGDDDGGGGDGDDTDIVPVRFYDIRRRVQARFF